MLATAGADLPSLSRAHLVGRPQGPRLARIGRLRLWCPVGGSWLYGVPYMTYGTMR
jgi:TnpA family transposase